MSVLTKLSDKAYLAMRKAMVQEVYKSETLTISEVAAKHKIHPSTLGKWCNKDLGPNQLKWLIEQSHKIRGQRISNKKKNTTTAPKVIKTTKTNKQDTTTSKNKPWAKKKARIESAQTMSILDALKDMGITNDEYDYDDVIDIRGVFNAPTVKPTLPISRKLLGATVIINLDEYGKFIKYEVTGDVSVQVFTRT
jgi:transposase-like protein